MCSSDLPNGTAGIRCTESCASLAMQFRDAGHGASECPGTTTVPIDPEQAESVRSVIETTGRVAERARRIIQQRTATVGRSTRPCPIRLPERLEVWARLRPA